MWSFASPLALLLLPLPLFVRRVLPPSRRRDGAVYLPSAMADGLVDDVDDHVARKWARALAPSLLWALLIIALAGPGTVELSDAIPASGRDIALVLDLSGSMEKTDFSLDGVALSRLDAVKRVGARFVRGRVGDRVSLVIFGDRAYVAAPLTFDTEAVARSIETATIGVSGRATTLADGLGLAVKRLSDSQASSKVVVFLSDGVDTSGLVDVSAVAGLAERRGIRVHTIALGPDSLESAPDVDDAVDTATLRMVAERSGGMTFRVRDMSDLTAVAAEIDRLEPSPSRRPPLEIRREMWIYPAMGALLLACLLVVAQGREP